MKAPPALYIWFLSLPLALLLTGGSQACEPAWLPVAIVSAMALVLGWLALERDSLPLSVGSLAALSLLPMTRMFAYGGLPATRDGGIHLWNAWSAAKALALGDPWPRWLDTVGIGLPVGQFYPPLAYLLAALPMTLGAESRDVLIIVGWTTGILGALGVYAVCRDLEWSRAHGLLTASLFIVTPYRLFDLNYRFALGELIGLAVLLPFWHGCTQVLRGRDGPVFTRPWWLMWISGVVLALGHPQSLVMAAVLLPVLGAAFWWLDGRLAGLRTFTWVTVLVAGTSAFQLVPSVTEQHHTSIDRVMPDTAKGYAVKGLDPFSATQRRRWSGLREDASERERDETMWGRQRDYNDTPFYLGLPLLFALPLGIVGAIRERRDTAAWGILAIAALLATLSPVAAIMGKLPILHPLQFPWRFLGPATLGLLMVLMGWLRTREELQSRAWLLAVLAVVLVDASPGLGAASWMERSRPGVALSSYVLRQGPPTCRSSSALGYHALPVDLDRIPEPTLKPATHPRQPSVMGESWVGYPTGDLPPRLAGVRLPPRRLGVDVAVVNPVPLEFFTPKMRERFWVPIRQPNPTPVLEDAGVSLQLATRTATAPRILAPWPRVRLRRDHDLWGLAAHVNRPTPRDIRLRLPDDTPEGRLIFVEQAFPGWMVRLDGRRWTRVQAERGLLAVDIPRGTQRVEFHYDASTPTRTGSLLVSLLTVMAGLLYALRRRQGTAP